MWRSYCASGGLRDNNPYIWASVVISLVAFRLRHDFTPVAQCVYRKLVENLKTTLLDYGRLLGDSEHGLEHS